LGLLFFLYGRRNWFFEEKTGFPMANKLTNFSKLFFLPGGNGLLVGNSLKTIIRLGKEGLDPFKILGTSKGVIL